MGKEKWEDLLGSVVANEEVVAWRTTTMRVKRGPRGSGSGWQDCKAEVRGAEGAADSTESSGGEHRCGVSVFPGTHPSVEHPVRLGRWRQTELNGPANSDQA